MALSEATYEIACSGNVGDEEWANVWHVLRDSTAPGTPISDADANSIMDVIQDFYNDIKGQLHTSWSLLSMDFRQLGEVRLPIQRAVTTVTGTFVGSILPLQVSLLMSMRTALPGRSRRGRTYLCGFTESANTGGGRVEPATNAVVGAAIQEVATDLAAIGGNTLLLAVYSRTLDDAIHVETVQIPSLWAEQRRRVNKLNPIYTSYAL